VTDGLGQVAFADTGGSHEEHILMLSHEIAV
jgi:hypothetical protein